MPLKLIPETRYKHFNKFEKLRKALNNEESINVYQCYCSDLATKKFINKHTTETPHHKGKNCRKRTNIDPWFKT